MSKCPLRSHFVRIHCLVWVRCKHFHCSSLIDQASVALGCTSRSRSYYCTLCVRRNWAAPAQQCLSASFQLFGSLLVSSNLFPFLSILCWSALPGKTTLLYFSQFKFIPWQCYGFPRFKTQNRFWSLPNSLRTESSSGANNIKSSTVRSAIRLCCSRRTGQGLRPLHLRPPLWGS